MPGNMTNKGLEKQVSAVVKLLRHPGAGADTRWITMEPKIAGWHVNKDDPGRNTKELKKGVNYIAHIDTNGFPR